MKLYIKYMVSQRCKLLVQKELNELGISYRSIDLGVVDVSESLSDEQFNSVRTNLLNSGLEVLDNKRAVLVESIKNVIIDLIHYSDDIPKKNYSDLISEKLGYDYTYLANVFSAVKGTTIQQFIIVNKIERVKEFLLYDELTLTEIALRLHYSSVAHLSNQFKKITGLTPTFYKGIAEMRRVNLESI
jgi:AraC-like DNA-binding protein